MKRNIKRWMSGVLVCSLIMTSMWVPVPVSAQTEESKPNFIDMRGHYAEEAVKRLTAFQYVNGISSDRFGPQEYITRQNFAALLAKTAGLVPSENSPTSYSDVADGTPQAVYIKALGDIGILKGKADQSIGANESLTRQDMAVLLQRLTKVLPLQETTGKNGNAAKPTFLDEKEIADYAKEATQQVASLGWMVGSNQSFLPQKKVTRAEAAVVIDRMVAMRVTQAEKTEFEVNVEKLTILAGTSQQIVVNAKGSGKLPFAPVFAFDYREIGTIMPDGLFIAGPKAGVGQITVTVGYKTRVIPVEITVGAGESATATPTAATDVTDENKNTLWNPTEGIENFALNSHFSVKPLDPSDSTFEKMEKKYPGPVGGLVVPSETWTGYLRQLGREITVSLDENQSLHQVALTFKQESKLGIYFPTQMEVEVSKDCKAWSHVGKVLNSVSQADEKVMEHTMIVSLPPVDAGYVRVRFPVKVFVFARQLQVLGHPELQPFSTATFLAPSKKIGVYEDKKDGVKMENLLLAFSGGYGELGTWRMEDFLPHVGYINTDGVITDRMFDSILFMPYPNLPSTKGGWEFYIDNLFDPMRQLDALNQAMLELNKRRRTLVISPAIENVVLALPYPSPKMRDFGKVVENQDSLSFDPTHVGEDRAAKYRAQAVQWYLDKVLKRWNESDFRYLRLDGIYWYHELIDEAAPKERQLIREVSNMVHDQSLRFYWIPYFGSSGIADWKELGFDYAFLQPNFYFDKTIPVERMEVALATANKYGMGVEVEGDGKMITDLGFYQMYYNQLIAGHKLGIDKNKIHAYYFGSKNLLDAYRSKDPNARAIYDDTYKWMRGKFTIHDYMNPIQAP